MTVQKATALIDKAAKELDGVRLYSEKRDVQGRLHHAVNGLIGMLTPTAGKNGQQITWVHPNLLRSDMNTFTNIGDKAIAELTASIHAIGIINPIEVTPEYIIITGHQRHRAALDAGLSLVPVKMLEGLSAADIAERQVAENVTQRKGSAQNANPTRLVKALRQK